MQPRVLHMMKTLGLDAGHVPASNLVFGAVLNAKMPSSPSSKTWRKRAPFHEDESRSCRRRVDASEEPPVITFFEQGSAEIASFMKSSKAIIENGKADILNPTMESPLSWPRIRVSRIGRPQLPTHLN